MKILLLPLALLLLPLMLGSPWLRLLPERRGLRLLVCWPLGYFLMLALFEILAVPYTWFRRSFYDLAPAYAWVLAAAAGCSCLAAWILQNKHGNRRIGSGPEGEKTASPMTYWEWLYLLAFLVLVAFQLVRAVTWDTTVMNYDDSEYLTLASDALRHGALLGINDNTGIAEAVDMKRILQGYLFFPAWLSWISGLSVPVLARTVLETVHLGMAYVVFSAFALVLFPKRENSLIFLLLVSLLFLVGHYSHYSPTFRLLGPNYQGKATLAVIFFPLVFALMIAKLPERYDAGFGILLTLLSLTAVSLTLFGTTTMVFNVGLPVLLSLVRKPRRWSHLVYVMQASVVPVACVAAYLLLS